MMHDVELEVRTDSICHLLVHLTHDFADHEFPFKFVRLPVPAAAPKALPHPVSILLSPRPVSVDPRASNYSTRPCTMCGMGLRVLNSRPYATNTASCSANTSHQNKVEGYQYECR